MTAIFLIVGCDKEKYGSVRQQIRCTSENTDVQSKSQKGIQDLKYTQFGDFITTITPTSFIGELDMVRYFADNPDDNFIALFGGVTGDEAISTDFRIDSTISVIPTLCCNVYDNPDGEGGYFKNDVTLKYLYIRMGLETVFELPEDYKDITLSNFQTQQNGNIITTNLYALNSVVAELHELGQEMNIYFGQTDSTYISHDNPFPNFNSGINIRSDRFNEWTLTPPLPQKTKTVVSTLNFVIDDIIHIYSGPDNIPYTNDDVIVFEPKFWERIKVEVDIYEQ